MATRTVRTSSKAIALTSEILTMEEQIINLQVRVEDYSARASSLAIENAEKGTVLGWRTKQLAAAEAATEKVHVNWRHCRENGQAMFDANLSHKATNVQLTRDIEANEATIKYLNGNVKDLEGDLECVERCGVRQGETVRKLQAEAAVLKNRVVAYKGTTKRLVDNEIKLVSQKKCYKAAVRDAQNTIDLQRETLIKLRAELKDSEHTQGQLVDGIEELHHENEKLAEVQFPAFTMAQAQTEYSVFNQRSCTSIILNPLNISYGHGREDMQIMETSERARNKVARKIAAEVYKAVSANLNKVFAK